MSRCFPFPPPGYEGKARTNDEAVLKKEKQKEKKHKKDKKDKEKSEKDRSDGRNREKKDKKEKNRDKKKDKEKVTDKVKDKPGTSDGTRLSRNIENHVTEKLTHKDDRDKRNSSQVGGYQAEKFGQKSDNSHLHPQNRNSVSVEMAKKTKDEARGIRNGSYHAEKFGPNSHLPAESRKLVSADVAWKANNEARGSQVGGYQGEKLDQSSHLPEENRNSALLEVARKTKDEARGSQVGGYQSEKLGQNSHLPTENRKSVSMEVARKTKDEARGIKNQLAEKITSADRKKDEGMFRFVAKINRTLAEVKETQKDKKVDTRKPDVQEVRVAPRVSGSAMVQNSGRPVEVPGGMVQAKVQGLSKSLEKNVERKADGKERSKEKEGDDKRREKRKDKDREKKTEGKEKDRDKEKKKKEDKAKKKNSSKTAEPDKKKLKEDKENEQNGSKHAEPDKSRETIKEFPIDSQSSRPSLPPKDSNKNTDDEGNLKKRKDLMTNGFLHVDETRPNKLPRPSSASHSSMQNGRTLEPFQSIPNASDMQEGANSVKVVNNVHKKNGFIEARPSSVSSAKPSKAAKADPFAEASMRPPHPDSKFISEVYTVPKMNELADDDQDWLFGCSDTKSKRLKVQSSPEKTTQVWSEALHIESADGIWPMTLFRNCPNLPRYPSHLKADALGPEKGPLEYNMKPPIHHNGQSFRKAQLKVVYKGREIFVVDSLGSCTALPN